GELARTVAGRLDVALRTVRKWWGRYRVEGARGLQDRSSRPHSSPRQTTAAIALSIKVLRLQRWTCAQIAGAVGVTAATASRLLRRAGPSPRGRPRAPPAGPRPRPAPPGAVPHPPPQKP